MILLNSVVHGVVVQSSDVYDAPPPSGSGGDPLLSEGLKRPERQEITEFHDEAQAPLSGLSIHNDGVVAGDITSNVDIQNFMRRPIRVASLTWSDATSIGNRWTYNPWQLYFSQPAIANKLANYAFLRCNLKVKVVLNASPFLYGCLLMYYRPLPGYKQTLIRYDSYQRWFMQATQLPHRTLYPQDSEGCEMTLPFIYHKQLIETSIASEFGNLGELTFTNLTTLKSANAATSQSITAAIYVWAEDVVLSGPSVGLVMQGGLDEYGTGPISAPASAVADIAGRLRGVPILGKFATATEIGASAISRIAKLFGFTNVPVIDNVSPMRPMNAPPLASTEIGFPIEKLTLDSKNELAIGPGHLGLPDKDELAISHLVQREAYLSSSTWSTSHAQGYLLFSAQVNPMTLLFNDFTISKDYYMPPMAWIGRLFKFWRGDIVFRFRVIASQYHKGRLLISYDPLGTSGSNLTSVSAAEGQVFTKIVDIGEQGDVELAIPYQQAFPWLKVPLWTSVETFSPQAAGFTYDPTTYNGIITVRVLTKLTAPVASADTTLLTYIRGSENLEFADPIEMSDNFSLFTIQSQDVYDEASPSGEIPMGSSQSKPHPYRYRFNHGEKVVSLRTLLRRFNLSEVMMDPTSFSTNPLVVQTSRFSRFPLMYGYDPYGIHTAKGIAAPASNFFFNFVHNTVYNWIAPAFLAQKGSTFWHINFESPTPINFAQVSRTPSDTGGASRSTTGTASGSISANAAWLISKIPVGTTGSAIVNTLTNAGLSVSCPNYTNALFQYTDQNLISAPWGQDGLNGDNLSLVVSCNNANTPTSTQLKTFKYFAVGTDFNLYFFLCTPSFEYYSSTPAAV